MGKVMHKLIVSSHDSKYNTSLGTILCGAESCKICISYFLTSNSADKESCIPLLPNVESCGAAVSGLVLEFEATN